MNSDNCYQLLIASFAALMCFFAPQSIALSFVAVYLFTRLPYFYPGEWRLYLQMPVLGWVADSIFLRMEIVSAVEPSSVISRAALWMILASLLSHVFYPYIQKHYRAMLLGAAWGLIVFVTPVMLANITASVSHAKLMLISAATGAAITLIFSFMVTQRIRPAET